VAHVKLFTGASKIKIAARKLGGLSLSLNAHERAAMHGGVDRGIEQAFVAGEERGAAKRGGGHPPAGRSFSSEKR
jgi:hypothetical protein